MVDTPLTPIEIGLTAPIVAVDGWASLRFLVASDDTQGENARGLPFGPSIPLAHRTFRDRPAPWVEARPGCASATWSSFTRSAIAAATRAPPTLGPHMVSVGYLALTSIESAASLKIGGAGFEPWVPLFSSPRIGARSSAILIPSCAAR